MRRALVLNRRMLSVFSGHPPSAYFEKYSMLYYTKGFLLGVLVISHFGFEDTSFGSDRVSSWSLIVLLFFSDRPVLQFLKFVRFRHSFFFHLKVIYNSEKSC